MRNVYIESEDEIIRINPPVTGELRENGTSANIQIGEGVTIQSLIGYGFRKIGGDKVVFSRKLGCGIDFFVIIQMQDLNDIKIDVIDDDFGQPYDYQLHIMNSDKPGHFATAIYEKVEAELEKLQDAGIIHGHVRGNYV